MSVTAQTQRTESLVVIRAAGLNPGDVLNRDNLQDAIRRIYATGLFARVEADTTLIADGVRVLFRVAEFARLKPGGPNFIGNHKVSAKELAGKLAAKDRELLTEKKVFDWTQKISDLYKQKGFVLSKVSSRTTPSDAKGEAELQFFIEEGDRIRIKKVAIRGATAVPEKAILGKLVNKAYSWPFQSGAFKDDEFKKDLDRITEFYKEKGFLDAGVMDYDLRYDSGWVYVTVNVTEGPKYFFGALEFKGESLFTVAQLSPMLRAQRGDVYNQKKVNQVLTDLFGMYSEQGYIYASIQPVDSIRYDTVDVGFKIVENTPARIRLVNVEGNDRTIEKVIRREIVSMPGSTFKRSEVIRSQQNIFNLGFFEDVNLDYRKVADTSSDIDLTYKVKEKFAGNVGAGVSYSATDGIVGNVELTQPNMFGRAEQMHVKVEYGKSLTNFELGWAEPWLFDTPTSLGANLFWTTQIYTDYTRRDRGGEVNFSRPLPLDYTRGYLTLHVGDVRLSNINTASTINPGDTFPKLTVSTTFRFDRDSRDYIFNPSSGSYNSYSLELAGAGLAGDVHYYRHVIESDFYYPLFWKFVLRFRGHFGFVSNWRARDTVPPYERFYPGGTGDDGVRGYSDRTLPNLTGYNPGGLTEAIFSFEYRLKLSRSLALLAFFDAGNAWPRIQDVNLSDLKRGIGAGVRLEIPLMGWLGFDLGYGIDRPGATRFEPHFQIGAGFPVNF